MKTCTIGIDECYPFHTLDEHKGEKRPGRYVEVSAEFVERYERVMAEFDQLQGELEVMAKGADVVPHTYTPGLGPGCVNIVK